MVYVAVLLLAFIAVSGLVAFVAPSRLMLLLKSMNSRGGLYFAAGFRILLGAALWFSAPGSRDPEFMTFLGVFLVVAGFLLPLIGLKRFGRMLDWFRGLGSLFHRFWGIVATFFGVGLIYMIAW